MQTTNTPLSKSRLQIDFELPPERLTRSIDAAARRLSQQHRISGFRPGKAPRALVERVLGASTVLDEAVELLVEDAFRQAMREQDLAPLTSPEVEVTQAEEGKPVIFKATVQVRPRSSWATTSISASSPRSRPSTRRWSRRLSTSFG